MRGLETINFVKNRMTENPNKLQNHEAFRKAYQLIKLWQHFVQENTITNSFATNLSTKNIKHWSHGLMKQ